MLAGLLVADDQTGAADTGGVLAARGYTTAIGREAEDVDIRVVDTDTRTSDPEEAYDQVHRVVEATPTTVVYKKVDSTLRGNVAVETGAVLDATDADLAIVAPAFPANGRTTAAGIHMVDGVPVTETGFGDDDENPPTTSHLPTLLSEAGYPVESLGLEAIGTGTRAVIDRLEEIRRLHPNGAIIACDTTHVRHFKTITEAVDAVESVAVFVGSAGLAEYVPLGARTSGVLGLVGSTSPPTLAQLNHLDDDIIVRLEPEDAVSRPDEAVAGIVPRVVDRLEAREPVVVTAAETTQDVDTALSEGESNGLSPTSTRQRIAHALASTAVTVSSQMNIGGLFVTGGTITRTVFEELTVDGVQLSGQRVSAGVPVGRIHGGPADGTPVVTKAGGFGGEDTITTCLDYLSRVR